MSSPEALDALKFSSQTGLNAKVIDYRYRRLSDYFRGASCLELGCSDGRGIPFLLRHFSDIFAVDGSRESVEQVRSLFGSDPRVQPIHSMFEELDLGRTFDTVLLGHVLEHVDSPAEVLEVAKKHLAPQGALIADVPNGNSIHRHLGVELGLLAKTTDLNAADISIGHQRVYVPDRFFRELADAGLQISHRGGFFFKPFSNAQLEAMLPNELEALFHLGEKFPGIAAEMYAVCELSSP